MLSDLLRISCLCLFLRIHRRSFVFWGGNKLGSYEGLYPRKHGRNVPAATVADLSELWGRANQARRQKGLYVTHVDGRDAQIAKKKKKAVFT